MVETALGGAVTTTIYIPTTWNNTSHLSRRLLFLFITLALTCGSTIYIAITERSAAGGGSLALILGIVQLFIAVVVTLLFSVMPSGPMFGDRVGEVKEIPH